MRAGVVLLILMIAAILCATSLRVRAQSTSPYAPVIPIASESLPPLPAAVLEIAPTGSDVGGDQQIRVIFAHDVVPLGVAEAVSRANLLAHFRLEPSWLCPDPIDYTAIEPQRVIAYATALGYWDLGPPYEIDYDMVAVTPGRYLWPGAVVRAGDEPETFGRTSSTYVTITP